ncbi:MAG: hypothetical protein EOO26_02950 [Comamonadaceae bacterium]|nr:MAG: hypothetical protein EOO26_02950 [Comamonadaceae bacterium]
MALLACAVQRTQVRIAVGDNEDLMAGKATAMLRVLHGAQHVFDHVVSAQHHPIADVGSAHDVHAIPLDPQVLDGSEAGSLQGEFARRCDGRPTRTGREKRLDARRYRANGRRGRRGACRLPTCQTHSNGRSNGNAAQRAKRPRDFIHDSSP